MDDVILVIGSGQMGPDIALSFALHGYSVVLAGRAEDRVAAAQRTMAASAQTMIEHGLLAETEWHAARERISGRVGFAQDAPRAGYVVEAIAEQMESKKALFAALEELVSPQTLLASITSALSPSELQRDLRQPERLIVTHYNRPAHLMPLCEVVPGTQTADSTVERAHAMLLSCGIRPVHCRDVPGFIFNRLHWALLREALALLRDGVASLEDIEDTLKLSYGARLPVMGPFEHADLNGLDLIATIAGSIYPHLDCSQDAAAGPLAELIAQGRLGMKTGQGFYDWTERDPDEFRRRRDEEIIRRLKILRADEQETRPQ